MPVQEEAARFSTAFGLLAVVVLVLVNGFFVMAEFALVAARRNKLAEMSEKGDRLARLALRAVGNLDRYISATQLGITLASLALGWIGEPALASLIDRGLAALGVDVPPGVAHSAAGVTTAFVIITFLHIVFGELAPKSIALVMPERASGIVALPLMAFAKLMTPFIWVLNGTANRILRLLHISPMSEAHHAHSPEEIRLLVMQARAHGTLDESDSAMLAGVFDFHRKRARDVMRPRTDMSAIPLAATKEQVMQQVRQERYSRYPVYAESLDDIEGVFLAKDLWLSDEGTEFSLRALVRECLFVPGSRSAERVLDDLRKSRAQMAVVLDEFGGTAGIITMEDLIEEVIGDIADEYDQLARLSIETDGVLELSGSLSLVDAQSDYRLTIAKGDWSTLGGFVFARVGRVPKVGDRVPIPEGELEVVAMNGRRVAALRLLRARAGAVVKPGSGAGSTR